MKQGNNWWHARVVKQVVDRRDKFSNDVEKGIEHDGQGIRVVEVIETQEDDHHVCRIAIEREADI